MKNHEHENDAQLLTAISIVVERAYRESADVYADPLERLSIARNAIREIRTTLDGRAARATAEACHLPAQD